MSSFLNLILNSLGLVDLLVVLANNVIKRIHGLIFVAMFKALYTQGKYSLP